MYMFFNERIVYYIYINMFISRKSTCEVIVGVPEMAKPIEAGTKEVERVTCEGKRELDDKKVTVKE